MKPTVAQRQDTLLDVGAVNANQCTPTPLDTVATVRIFVGQLD